MKRNKIIVIVGPTAVGKSALAVALARRFRGEIISADSRQVYRGLNIGTGKITRREMRGVPHHLLDVANPKKQFTVADYQRIARSKISEIFERGYIPILCGGAGLYIDSLLNSTTFPEVPPNPKLRQQLEKKSTEVLFRMLQQLDRMRATAVDRHNPRRLVRAIEIAKKLGKVPPLQHSDILENVGMLFIGFTLSGEALKKKISDRLHKRIRAGMIREVRKLHTRGLSWRRMEELGLEYRYVSRHLRGLLSKEDMLLKLQSETWYYAKRQLVWFKRNKQIKWFRPTEKRPIARAVKEFLST